MLEPESTDSEFVCADCGARESSVSVAYDTLGYAVCPACGASNRPTASADEWTWSGDLVENPSD
jgi:transcription elongation factor Elf1